MLGLPWFGSTHTPLVGFSRHPVRYFAFCAPPLGMAGTHVFANVTDGDGTKPNTLRHLLSDSFLGIAPNVNPEFEACSADEVCASCLEIDALTHCSRRDVGAINPETCGDVKDVICCVFENDQACMTNTKFKATIGAFAAFYERRARMNNMPQIRLFFTPRRQLARPDISRQFRFRSQCAVGACRLGPEIQPNDTGRHVAPGNLNLQ